MLETITLTCLALAQCAGNELFDVLKTLSGDVAGNAAHDLTKHGVRALGERIARGELSRNHDLARACRRASLRATQFSAYQFAFDRRRQAAKGQPGAAWEAQWASELAERCWAEAQQARSASYHVPASALDGGNRSRGVLRRGEQRAICGS